MSHPRQTHNPIVDVKTSIVSKSVRPLIEFGQVVAGYDGEEHNHNVID
jgi:hypothetical protein